MATDPAIAVSNDGSETHESRVSQFSSAISDYWALTKPEVNFLILITTFAGFYLASASGFANFHPLLAFHTLLGTLLVAGGTASLNQALECSFDRQMRRTARRPVAADRIQRSHAFIFGGSLAIAGAAYLRIEVNGLACLLAIITLATYLLLYTPLKRVTPLCILGGCHYPKRRKSSAILPIQSRGVGRCIWNPYRRFCFVSSFTMSLTSPSITFFADFGLNESLVPVQTSSPSGGVAA